MRSAPSSALDAVQQQEQTAYSSDVLASLQGLELGPGGEFTPLWVNQRWMLTQTKKVEDVDWLHYRRDASR